MLRYDAVFVPGGLGPMVDIAKNLQVQRAIARAWDAGTLVAAVCHGPCALLVFHGFKHAHVHIAHP